MFNRMMLNFVIWSHIIFSNVEMNIYIDKTGPSISFASNILSPLLCIPQLVPENFINEAKYRQNFSFGSPIILPLMVILANN